MHNFDISISNTYFSKIEKTGNGGAIEINRNSLKLLIEKTKFEDMKVTNFGGSIYASISYFEMKYDVFHNSQTSSIIDEKYGQAAYFNSRISLFTCSSFDNCGPSERSGDSPYVVRDISTVDYMNMTHNGGKSGASGFMTFSTSNIQSHVSYINVIDPFDNHAIGTQSYLKIDHSNFINTTKLRLSILWQYSDNLTTFEFCTFLDSFNIFLASDSNGYTIIDCQSDKLFDGIKTTTIAKTIYFTINQKQNGLKSCKQNNIRNESILINFLFIIIITNINKR